MLSSPAWHLYLFPETKLQPTVSFHKCFVQTFVCGELVEVLRSGMIDTRAEGKMPVLRMCEKGLSSQKKRLFTVCVFAERSSLHQNVSCTLCFFCKNGRIQRGGVLKAFSL